MKETGEKMRIITIASRKGGTGKSTTASAIANGLRIKGRRVLLVDLDSQANLTYTTGAQGGGITALEVLTGTATAAEAIQHTEQADIIPAGQQLAAADLLLTDIGKEYRLREALEPIRGQYDYIIIDTPAGLGIGTTNALTASDGVIIPVTADMYSLQGCRILEESIRSVKKYCNPDLKIDGLLITRYSGRANLSKAMKNSAEEIAADMSTKVYSHPIRECVAIKEAAALRQGVFDYAPKSNAAKDYAALINEIERG